MRSQVRGAVVKRKVLAEDFGVYGIPVGDGMFGASERGADVCARRARDGVLRAAAAVRSRRRRRCAELPLKSGARRARCRLRARAWTAAQSDEQPAVVDE